MNYEEMLARSSPRPWRIEGSVVLDANGDVVSNDLMGLDDVLAVQAVNSHEQIVAALEKAYPLLVELWDDYDQAHCPAEDALSAIEAALALAKEGKP